MNIVGSLLSFPYLVLFYVVWVVASIARPLLVFSIVCVLSNPTSALRKFHMFLTTVQYILFCNDKTWQEPPDPSSYFTEENANKIERKTVIFVRHGESCWNDTFNKGDRSLTNFITYFVPNLFQAIVYEWFFWVSGRDNESWFYDSPLSAKGLGQARGIQRFLAATNVDFATPKEAELIRLLLHGEDSQLVSSNLRRSIATMLVGFTDRLAKNSTEKLIILTDLQEISRNPDALAITPPNAPVVPSWTDPKAMAQYYASRIDTSLYVGNKSLSSTGLDRMTTFCNHSFDSIPNKKCVIVGGHSLWFRSFFRTFLPHEFDHVAKKKKLMNGGIVGFTLERIPIDESQWAYRLDPKSIVVVYGGF